MNYYVSGDQHGIIQRLHFEKRLGEIILVQLHVTMDDDGPHWMPLPSGDFWPCEPQVGDTFMMEGAWSEDDKITHRRQYFWCVTGRDLMLSGIGASEMQGIILLKVVKVDGPFRTEQR